MASYLITGPASEPISLAEAKAHLALDAAFTTDDGLIAALIVAARESVETFTQRALRAQTWDLYLDGDAQISADPLLAQYDREIVIPRPPLQSITFVKYTDLGGTVQTWDPSLYVVDAPVGPKALSGRLRPAYLQPWPVVQPVMNAFQIRFVAGYVGTPLAVSSITSSGGVATVTTQTAHGYRQSQIVTIAGADQAAYNGDFPVASVLNSTQFTYAVSGSPVTPATGTITATDQGIPQAIKQGLLLKLGDLYDHRNDTPILEGGQNLRSLPVGAEALLWPYRALEW